jgi:tetratricopeptide (TPR) repeat protein
MTEISEAIQRGWAAADGEGPAPTVAYFRELLARFPEDPRALLAYAGALDFAGLEAEAVPVYEQALAAGLDGDDLRQAMVQYGSTLRNLGRDDDALALLIQADGQFPGYASVQAFLALALSSAGRDREAVQLLLNLVLDRIDADELQRYQRALRGYAADLTHGLIRSEAP